MRKAFGDVKAVDGISLQVARGKVLDEPAADSSDSAATLTVVDGMAKDLSLQTQLIAGFWQMGEMLAANPDDGQVFTAERAVAQAQSQFERAKTVPLVAVEQKVSDTILQEREESSAVGLDRLRLGNDLL